jgi:hypothetical protein
MTACGGTAVGRLGQGEFAHFDPEAEHFRSSPLDGRGQAARVRINPFEIHSIAPNITGVFRTSILCIKLELFFDT